MGRHRFATLKCSAGLTQSRMKTKPRLHCLSTAPQRKLPGLYMATSQALTQKNANTLAYTQHAGGMPQIHCGVTYSGWTLIEGVWRVHDGGWWVRDGGWRVCNGGWRVRKGGCMVLDGGWRC